MVNKLFATVASCVALVFNMVWTVSFATSALIPLSINIRVISASDNSVVTSAALSSSTLRFFVAVFTRLILVEPLIPRTLSRSKFLINAVMPTAASAVFNTPNADVIPSIMSTTLDNPSTKNLIKSDDKTVLDNACQEALKESNLPCILCKYFSFSAAAVPSALDAASTAFSTFDQLFNKAAILLDLCFPATVSSKSAREVSVRVAQIAFISLNI